MTTKRKTLFASLSQDTMEQVAMSPTRRKMLQAATHSASNSFHIPDTIPDMIEEEEVAFKLFQIYHKNLEQTSVQIDFPRLAKRIKIKDLSGKYVTIDKISNSDEHSHHQSNGDGDSQSNNSDHINISIIHNILKTLLQLTQPSKQPIPSLEIFESEYSPRHINEILNKYFGETHPVVQILKLCTQQIFAPAVVQIKKCIQHYAQYQDFKGGWSIEIDFSTNGKVIVGHNKQEVVFSKNSSMEHEDLYKFYWLFQITLDKQNPSYSSVITPEQVQLHDLVQGSLYLSDFCLEYIKTEQLSATPQEQMELSQKDLERLLRHVFNEVRLSFSAKSIQQCLRKLEVLKLEAK